MKRFKYLAIALFATFPALAQIPAPQINLSGNIGCQGFPCVNNGTLIMASDANRTMTAQETSAFYIRVTSSVSLTATRNLVAPAGRFPFTIENATTGGQSIQIIGASGTGITIPNGQTVAVWNDGTNFVLIGPPGGSGGASFPSSGTPCVPWATSTTASTCLTLTTTGSSGPSTLSGATLNIPQYSGGSGCAEGTCVVNAPVGAQVINQPSGTYLNPNCTNWGTVSVPNSNDCLFLGGTLTSYVGDTGGGSVSGVVNLQDVFANVTDPGWGGVLAGGPQWQVTNLLNGTIEGHQKGIEDGIDFNINHWGLGDTTGAAILLSTHNGYAFSSDEGSDIIRGTLTEVAGPTGTVATGGSGATTVTAAAKMDRAGVGQALIDTTTGGVTTTQTLTGSVGSFITIATTAASGFPVSYCGTLSGDMLAPRLPNNATSSETFQISNGSPYGGSATALVTMVGNGGISRGQLTSVGAYSSGLQTFTGNFYIHAFNGSNVCVGGLVSEYEKAAAIPGEYYVYVVGSTSNTLYLTTLPQGTPTGAFSSAGAVTIYKGAEIKTVDVSQTVFGLTPNDAAWTAGDAIEQPNYINAQDEFANLVITNLDPVANITGLNLFENGVPLLGSSQMINTWPDSDASKLISQGGTGHAPSSVYNNGIVGVGQYFAYPPSDAFRFGNSFPAGLDYVECVNNGATLPNGCATTYNLWYDHNTVTNIDSGSVFTRATNTLNFRTFPSSTPIVLQQNGHQVCDSSGAGGGVCGASVALKTNTVLNTSQAVLDATTSTANTVGLTVTPSNTSGGVVKWEITGGSYTGNAATATNLAGGALGSAPYQSAANTTAYIASPTTTDTYFYGWTPTGSIIAPAAKSLTTYMASPAAIGGTTPAAGTFTIDKATSVWSGTVSTIAAASTIAPTTPIVILTGSGTIHTITPQTGCTTSGTDCTETFITDASGPPTIANDANIAAGYTLSIDATYVFAYDPANGFWYPSPVSGGGAPAFSAITAGTNTAALVEGSGGSLNPGGTGIINSNQVNGLALPTNGQRITYNPSGQAVSLHQLMAVESEGDSLDLGIGTSDVNTYGAYATITASTNALSLPNAISGTRMADIARTTFGTFVPDPILPSVLIMNGGANDGGNTCSGTLANCTPTYQVEEQAAYTWASIPVAYRTLASNCVQTSGSWTADTTTVPLYNNLGLYSTDGTAMKAGTSTNVLTCTTPVVAAGTKVGFWYTMTTSATGAFQVSVDGGAAITDQISGTTTISAGPGTGSTVFGTSTTVTPAAQEATVTASGSGHTLAFTLTASANVEIIGVYIIPPPTAPAINAVYDMATTANWTNYTVWNAAKLAAVAKEQADGLPVFYVDLVGGTPGVNATTTVCGDISAVAGPFCAATTAGSHWNRIGAMHAAQTIQNAEFIASTFFPQGWVFSAYTGGNPAAKLGLFQHSFTVETNSADLTHVSNYSRFNCSSFVNGGNGTASPCATGQGDSGFDLYDTAFAGFGMGHVGTDSSSGKPWSAATGMKIFEFGAVNSWLCLSSIWDGNAAVGDSHYTCHGGFNLSTGEIATDSFTTAALMPQGNVAPVASATTIAPTAPFNIISGTTTVTTITAPSGTAALVGAAFDFITTSAVPFNTGGNIATSFTTTANTLYRCVFMGTTNGNWYCK